VERPGIGDQSRGWGPPFVGTESAYFLSVNRNKRSLTLNLNHARGIEILQTLLHGADVFIVNQPRRASLAKRGLDFDSLSAANPRLIYCSITGYGFTGPKAECPGYDILAQAEAGLMSFTGEPEGEPMRFPVPMADITCGIYATLGILAALLARQQSGRGQFLDMALLDCQLSWLANAGSSYLNAGELPRRLGNAHANIVPYQLFRGSDGRFLVVGVGTEKLWSRFCQVLGLEDTLGRDPHFASNRRRIERREELVSQLEKVFLSRPAQGWLKELRAAGIPVAPVHSVSEALSHPQAQARGMVVEMQHPLADVVRSLANPVKMSAPPVSYRLPPPLLGEHTEPLLRELGLTEEQAVAARVEGVV